MPGVTTYVGHVAREERGERGAAAMTSWRRLHFFSSSATAAPDPLARATVYCALADGGLAVADANGACSLLRRDFSSRGALFTAHSSGVLHLMQPDAKCRKCISTPQP